MPLNSRSWRRVDGVEVGLLCHALVTSVLLGAGGTRWSCWLRHCSRSRNVAGSIPDGVIGILPWHNPSGRTMALGSIQSLTEMSTWWYRRSVRRADNLTTFMCWLSWNLGALNSWNPHGFTFTWSWVVRVVLRYVKGGRDSKPVYTL